jgi:hypothetical protein
MEAVALRLIVERLGCFRHHAAALLCDVVGFGVDEHARVAGLVDAELGRPTARPSPDVLTTPGVLARAEERTGVVGCVRGAGPGGDGGPGARRGLAVEP